MTTKVFVGVSAAAWPPCGLFCFLRPEFLADAAKRLWKVSEEMLGEQCPL